jgi:hypothetical protein
MTHEHDLPLAEYHRAGVEITNGNPDVYKSLYSAGTMRPSRIRSGLPPVAGAECRARSNAPR